MRIALVHDWLTGMRGGERTLARAAEVLPGADLFTLIHVPGSVSPQLEALPIRTSHLSRLPGVRHYYRHLLPLMPGAIERFDLSDYDLILSFSHCVAKGFSRRPAAVGGPRRGVHVCYCFTPMRYVWTDVGDDQGRGLLGAAGLRVLRPWLRRWDLRSADNVDRFISMSPFTTNRIQACYGRSSDVLSPPVETDYFTPDPAVPREDWYLVVSALTPYKRAADAVLACGPLAAASGARGGRRRLRIIGTGPQRDALARLARGYPGIELLGWRSDADVRDAYRRCRALLMPQVEDFGIVPLEALACGAPVIACGAGGAADTLLDGETAILYRPQGPEGLAAALHRFEASGFNPPPDRLVRAAAAHGVRRFQAGLLDILSRAGRAGGVDVTALASGHEARLGSAGQTR